MLGLLETRLLAAWSILTRLLLISSFSEPFGSFSSISLLFFCLILVSFSGLFGYKESEVLQRVSAATFYFFILTRVESDSLITA